MPKRNRDPWEIRLNAGPKSGIDEIVSLRPVIVHLERMDVGLWYLALHEPGGEKRKIAIDIGTHGGRRVHAFVCEDEAGVTPKCRERQRAKRGGRG